jgi:hypothetical protein
MAKANLNDRASIEAIYPETRWEQDAARNTQGNAAVIHGVKILSEPDADGSFELKPMAQHVGEGDRESDVIFLPAFEADAGGSQPGSTYGSSAAPTADHDTASEYARFIDSVIEAARTADFKPAIGKGDERIKGFRGG